MMIRKPYEIKGLFLWYFYEMWAYECVLIVPSFKWLERKCGHMNAYSSLFPNHCLIKAYEIKGEGIREYSLCPFKISTLFI